MTQFEAKTAAELRGEPAEAPKQPQLDPLCKWADGTAVNVFYHRDPRATVQNVLKPGYFDFMRDTFISGRDKSVIHYVICVLGAAPVVRAGSRDQPAAGRARENTRRDDGSSGKG